MTAIATREHFYDDEVVLNPLDELRDARATSPVFLTRNQAGMEIYVVASYALIKDVLDRPGDFSNDYATILRPTTGNAEAAAIIAETGFDYARHGSFLLTRDDPEHARLRELVAPAFTVGAVNRQVQRLEVAADRLIDSFIASGRCDLYGDFAIPFTLGAILGVMGLDEAMWPQAYRWTSAGARRISHMLTPEQEVADARELAGMIRFLQELVQKLRAQPGDDLMSRVLMSRVDGRALTDQEAVSFLHEMMFAGNETTRANIVATMALLIRHPEQLAMVRANPALASDAVEEALRHHSTATSIWRIAARDTRIGETDIPKGAVINVRFDSANRDEAVFEDADRFDITRRKARQNLTFGSGVHHCIGNLLARRETIIAVAKMSARLDDPAIDEANSDFRRDFHILAHSLRAVTIKFRPGQRMS